MSDCDISGNVSSLRCLFTWHAAISLFVEGLSVGITPTSFPMTIPNNIKGAFQIG